MIGLKYSCRIAFNNTKMILFTRLNIYINIHNSDLSNNKHHIFIGFLTV